MAPGKVRWASWREGGQPAERALRVKGPMEGGGRRTPRPDNRPRNDDNMPIESFIAHPRPLGTPSVGCAGGWASTPPGAGAPEAAPPPQELSPIETHDHNNGLLSTNSLDWTGWGGASPRLGEPKCAAAETPDQTLAASRQKWRAASANRGRSLLSTVPK
jgi:hypothetical protein